MLKVAVCVYDMIVRLESRQCTCIISYCTYAIIIFDASVSLMLSTSTLRPMVQYHTIRRIREFLEHVYD
jgi:hypothetical protein